MMIFSNINIAIYMATFLCQNSRKLTTFNRLQIFQEGSSGLAYPVVTHSH